MKKISILAIAFTAITFASCKKDYTCTCTGTFSTTTTTTKIKSTSKSGAQANCVSGTRTYSGYGADVQTCTLSK